VDTTAALLELYGLPPEDFTAARNELAKAAGRRRRQWPVRSNGRSPRAATGSPGVPDPGGCRLRAYVPDPVLIGLTMGQSQPRRAAVRLAWKRVEAPSWVISRWTRRCVVRSLQPWDRAIAESVRPAASSSSRQRTSGSG
jgi:hypothetical protein